MASEAGAGGGSMGKTIAVLALLTLLAAGIGALLGRHLVGQLEDTLKQKASEAEEEEPAPKPVYTGKTRLLKLAPIVGNLASPQDTWIRLEASVVLADGELLMADVLAGEIAEDILAYLRTVSLPELQGASGLLHLSEDLNDRAAIRSNDQVHEVVIETLVVQ